MKPATDVSLIGLLALIQLAAMEEDPRRPAALTGAPFRFDGIEIRSDEHLPEGTLLPLGPTTYLISAADYRRAVESGKGLRGHSSSGLAHCQ